MRVYFVALFLLTAGIASGDIPDHTIKWDHMTVIEKPGNDVLCDCVMSDDCSSFKLIHLSGTEYGKELWLLEMDRTGEILCRTELLSGYIDQVEWVLPRFISDSTMAVAYSFRSEAGDPEIQIVDLSSPGAVRTISLSSLFPDDVIVRITSIEPSCTDRMILVGSSSRSSEQMSSLFIAALDLEGMIIWQTKLFESQGYVLEGSTLELLDDGGFILMDREDCFPSEGIFLDRLDAGGGEVWRSFIELDCEYYANFNDFTELDNGNILCTGGFDHVGGQIAYQGILVCLDPSGEELWRREDWYQDHTSFVSAEPVPGGGFMLTGWTGMEDYYAFEVMDMDVLIAKIDTEGITGFLIEEPGDQKPHSVYEISEGEYFITGEVISEGAEESDIFLGRIHISL